jgi:hypothetical protein
VTVWLLFFVGGTGPGEFDPHLTTRVTFFCSRNGQAPSRMALKSAFPPDIRLQKMQTLTTYCSVYFCSRCSAVQCSAEMQLIPFYPCAMRVCCCTQLRPQCGTYQREGGLPEIPADRALDSKLHPANSVAAFLQPLSCQVVEYGRLGSIHPAGSRRVFPSER